jgi:para-nitrobenzyl esterase
VRGLTAPRVLRPIRDGWVIVEDERPAFKNGRLHTMPIIVGSNVDEGSQFTAAWPIRTLEQYRNLVDANFSGMVDSALTAYPAAVDADVPPRVGEMFADTQFNYGTRLLAQTMASHNKPTWRYLFSRRRPQQKDGPHHIQEVPYVFGNLAACRPEDEPDFDATDEAISTGMMKAWVAFATNGNPNRPGLAAWPAYNVATDCYLQFGDAIATGGGWRRKQLDFLDAYYAGDDHGTKGK